MGREAVIMIVEINFEHDKDLQMLIEMPCVPMIGDEFTTNADDQEEYEFYKVYARDFLINNGKFDKVKIWVKDL